MVSPLRPLATALVGALAISIVLAVSPSPAGACSCASYDDAEAFAAADAVFVARVDRVYPARSGSSANPEIAILQVTDVYKGSVDEIQGVATAAEGMSCGFDFVTGEAYLVFASETSLLLDLESEFLDVNRCSGTRLLSEGALAVDTVSTAPDIGGPPSDAAIRRQLGDPRSSLFPEAFIGLGVIAFVLGLAGYFSWRDKRRARTAG